MKLNVTTADGTIIHTIETETDGRQLGIVYALCLFLYTIPPEARDSAIEYILDSASVDVADIASALGCAASTVRRRFDRAKSCFRHFIKAGSIQARNDLFVDLDAEEEPEDHRSSLDTLNNDVHYFGITNIDKDFTAKDPHPIYRKNWWYGMDTAQSSDEENPKNT